MADDDKKIDQELEDFLEGRSEISRVYPQASSENVPEEVDEAVLNMARDSVRGGSSNIVVPFSGSWKVPMSLAAVLVLSVTVVLKMENTGLEVSTPKNDVPAMDVKPGRSEIAKDSQPGEAAYMNAEEEFAPVIEGEKEYSKQTKLAEIEAGQEGSKAEKAKSPAAEFPNFESVRTTTRHLRFLLARILSNSVWKLRLVSPKKKSSKNLSQREMSLNCRDWSHENDMCSSVR